MNPAHGRGHGAGRHVDVPKLQTGLLSGHHIWDLSPTANVSFRNCVEENASARTDCARYKLIAQVNAQKAKDCFSQLCRSKTLFTVPDSLSCDRTFVRDHEEAYYLDAMDKYLNAEHQELTVVDLPVLKRPLNNRAHCAFSKRAQYFIEHFERRRIGLWVPHDAYENREFSDADLSAYFPRVENWEQALSQPSALPVPVPFVVYYFHKELTAAEGKEDSEVSERIRRLRFCLRNEFYVLFLSVWWNEAFHGCRQYILEPSCINILEERCGAIPTIADKPVHTILEYMRTASRRSEDYQNWMCFRNESMESSRFFWAVQSVGEFDHSRTPGEVLFSSLTHRKINRSPHGIAYNRRHSLLDKKLFSPDLHRVRGLAEIVNLNGWYVHGPLPIGELFHKFVELHKDSVTTISQLKSDAESARAREEYHNRYAPPRDSRGCDDKDVYDGLYRETRRDDRSGDYRDDLLANDDADGGYDEGYQDLDTTVDRRDNCNDEGSSHIPHDDNYSNERSYQQRSPHKLSNPYGACDGDSIGKYTLMKSPNQPSLHRKKTPVPSNSVTAAGVTVPTSTVILSRNQAHCIGRSTPCATPNRDAQTLATSSSDARNDNVEQNNKDPMEGGFSEEFVGNLPWGLRRKRDDENAAEAGENVHAPDGKKQKIDVTNGGCGAECSDPHASHEVTDSTKNTVPGEGVEQAILPNENDGSNHRNVDLSACTSIVTAPLQGVGSRK